jgi:hypothetical protein
MFLSILLFSVAIADPGSFTFVSEGQPAPFEGALFDPLAVADMLTRAQTSLIECEINSNMKLSEQRAKFEADLKKKDITIDSDAREYAAALSYKQQQIDDLTKVVKGNSPGRKIIWYTAGVASGIAVTYGAYRMFGSE